MANITFGFVGGSLDNETLSCNPEQQTAESVAVDRYYRSTGEGEVGSRFSVPHEDGFEVYEVLRRLHNGNNVVVRAHYVAATQSVVDINEIFVRC